MAMLEIRDLDVFYGGIACLVMGGILLLINYKLAKSFKRTEGD